jgi:hypothetical protein
MTPPVKMPVLLSVGAQALHPFHVMSPTNLVAFYLSHFQPLLNQQQVSGQSNRFPQAGNSPQGEPHANLNQGMIPLNWILSQELGHQDHQIHHQPVLLQEMMAHEWALLDRQLQESPFGVCSPSSWPVKPSQSGEAGPSTDMVYQPPGQQNAFGNLTEVLNHLNKGNPGLSTGNSEDLQTPLQQVLSETIHQYIWNLMYPGLKKQVLKHEEGLDVGSAQQEPDQEEQEQEQRQVRRIPEDSF